jgi:hypothetical protein
MFLEEKEFILFQEMVILQRKKGLKLFIGGNLSSFSLRT